MKRAAQSTVGKISFEAQATRLVLRNPTGHCRIDLTTGELEFAAHGGRLRRLAARARVDAETGSASIVERGGPLRWTRVGADSDGAVAVELSRALDSGGMIHCRVSVTDLGFIVRTGASRARAAVTGLGLGCGGTFLSAGQSPRALRVAYCGAHSQSVLSRSEVVAISAGTRMRSWWVSAWFDAANESGFVVGFLEARRFAGRIDLTGFAGEIVNPVERMRPEAKVLWSEPAWIAPTAQVRAGLVEYGRQAGRRSGQRELAPASWGWGSWTRFADSIDTSLVLANARAVRDFGAGSSSQPLVHVDHGWEEQFRTHRPKPSWQARREFGGTVPVLARRLRAQDCRLGLWVVPFAINAEGPLPPSLRTAVLCDQAGNPRPLIGRSCYGVDPTSPAGEAWLRRLFAKLSRWGASHFKLDFLRVLLAHDPDDVHDGLTQPRNFCRAMTRAEAYRHGLEIVRDAVGPRAHLLACGAPLLPSAGLVDSCRVGSDIEAFWADGRTGVSHCAENVRCNFFWHGQTWRNDPDFLVVQGTRRLGRYWGAAVAFAGGAALVSGDLPNLPVLQRRELRRFLPALAGEPRPLEMAARHGVARILQTVSEGDERVWFVAFFNRDEKLRTGEIALEELLPAASGQAVAWDVLAGRSIGRTGRRWKVRIPPRDVRVVCIRMALDRPQVVGTSGHVAMDQSQLLDVTWDSERRELRCIRRETQPWPERIFIRVPAPFRPGRGSGLKVDARSRVGCLRAGQTRSREVAISFLSLA